MSAPPSHASSVAHLRLRLLVATSQALAFSALAAAVTPFFSGSPAPLGLTAVLVTASTALGLALGLWPDGAHPPSRQAQLRALVPAAAWLAAVGLLLIVRGASQAQALVWGVMGLTAAFAGLGAGRIESEDGARSLAWRSALSAIAAGVVGAILGHRTLPGPAALALVALLVAVVVHAVARAHFRAVDPDRVGRSAAAAVAVIAVLAVLLAIGPVHDAVTAFLSFAWSGIAFALTVVAVAVGYALWAILSLILLLIHPSRRSRVTGPSSPGKTATKHVATVVHASPLLQHLGPFLLLALVAAILVWLAGRALRRRADPDQGLYHDEILDSRDIARARRGAARAGPPAEGLARTYAQALGVLRGAQDAAAHPQRAETPNAVLARAAGALGGDSPALGLLRRLTAAYADWHYGHGPNHVPDPAPMLLRALREALPPARGGRRRGA